MTAATATPAPPTQDIPSSLLLGVRVHRVTMAQAVALIRTLLASSGHHQIVTVNAAMLVHASRDEDLRRIFNRATLITPDGMGVLLSGRILGRPFPERVAGVDLSDHLCALCAREGFRVFLLGAAPGVAQAAADVLQRRHPGLQVVGVQHGYYRRDEEPMVIQQIRAARPHLLLVALGFPRQEEWIAAHLESTGAAVAIGIGGSLDLFAGRVRLAPAWIRRLGLEWLYRLVREPRRWRVVSTLPLAVWLATRQRLAEWWKNSRRSG